MNTAKDAINCLKNGNPVQFQKIVTEMLYQKAADVLSVRRIGIAQSLFDRKD